MTTLNMPQEKRNTITRLITPHDKEVARRLRAIFMRKSSALGINQKELAERVGYSASTVNHHLHGRSALRGAKAILSYAKALEVSPEEIDPNFETLYPNAHGEDPIPLDVFNLKGRPSNRKVKIFEVHPSSLEAYELDGRYMPLYPPKTLIITTKNEPATSSSLSLVSLNGQLLLALIHSVTQRSMTYSIPPGFECCREYNIRTRKMSKTDIEIHFPFSKRKVPLQEVDFIAKVKAIELP